MIDGEENLDVIIEDMEDEYGTCEYLGALRVHSTEGSVPMYNTDQGNAQILCYVPDNEYVYDCILEEDGLVICSYQGYAGYIPAKFLNDECYYDRDEDEVEEEEEGCEEAFWEELSEPDDVVAEQYEIPVTTNESSQHIDEAPQAAEHGWLKIGGVNGCWRCEGCGGVFLTNMGWQLHSLSTPYWDPCHYVGSGYWQWWD